MALLSLLLRARAGGFMATWVDAEAAPVALSHPASLPMETSRWRLLGASGRPLG